MENNEWYIRIQMGIGSDDDWRKYCQFLIREGRGQVAQYYQYGYKPFGDEPKDCIGPLTKEETRKIPNLASMVDTYWDGVDYIYYIKK